MPYFNVRNERTGEEVQVGALDSKDAVIGAAILGGANRLNCAARAADQRSPRSLISGGVTRWACGPWVCDDKWRQDWKSGESTYPLNG